MSPNQREAMDLAMQADGKLRNMKTAFINGFYDLALVEFDEAWRLMQRAKVEMVRDQIADIEHDWRRSA
jgi:hypothetical protein